MHLRVNGETVEIAFSPHKTLLEVLREDLGLDGHQTRLRVGRVRMLRGARGRPAGVVLLGPRSRNGRARGLDRRGHGEGKKPSHPLQAAFADLGAAHNLIRLQSDNA